MPKRPALPGPLSGPMAPTLPAPAPDIQPTRVHPLNRAGIRAGGEYVLLWVQASVRVQDNHALEYAAQTANALGLPLVAAFGLTPSYPEANARHYRFLLEGLRDLRRGLETRGVPLHIGLGTPPEVVLARAGGAALVVTDVGYTRIQRQWREELGAELETRGIGLAGVESEAVIPVQAVSDKQEYAARTIRPKIHRLLGTYLHAVPVTPVAAAVTAPLRWPAGEDVSDPAAYVAGLPVDQSVGPGREEGGEAAALNRLREFVAGSLHGYGNGRGNPNADAASRLSAYLHYGHLSPVTAALAAQASGAPAEDIDAFLEELVVRRELSFNYCFYNPDYDRYAGLPAWARDTLAQHAGDEREHLYSPAELEAAQTHDPYWNAAQREMVLTGRMHNHMRMYWGKKILEWSPAPEEAHRVALWLNNKYEQDGRDPNSFVGVSWVFGLHDRPWARRPIFGTVRYMNAGGLKRKFDADAYAQRWNDPEAGQKRPPE